MFYEPTDLVIFLFVVLPTAPLPCFVDILFVLTALMSGKTREKTLEVLSQETTNFIGVLMSMILRVDWKPVFLPSTEDSASPDGTDDGRDHCTCHENGDDLHDDADADDLEEQKCPQAYLQLGILRAMQVFCERGKTDLNYQRSFLSLTEQEKVYATEVLEGPSPGNRAVGARRVGGTRNSKYTIDPERGILPNLIELLLSQPPKSVYTSHLASTVLKWVQASATCEQKFIASFPGLMMHVIKKLFGDFMGWKKESQLPMRKKKQLGSQVHQVYMDLLGQMTKFNPAVLSMVEKGIDKIGTGEIRKFKFKAEAVDSKENISKTELPSGEENSDEAAVAAAVSALSMSETPVLNDATTTGLSSGAAAFVEELGSDVVSTSVFLQCVLLTKCNPGCSKRSTERMSEYQENGSSSVDVCFDYPSLPIRQLKQMLLEKGADPAKFFEKSEMVDFLKKADGSPESVDKCGAADASSVAGWLGDVVVSPEYHFQASLFEIVGEKKMNISTLCVMTSCLTFFLLAGDMALALGKGECFEPQTLQLQALCILPASESRFSPPPLPSAFLMLMN
jgi:hypothetical protein